MPSFGAILVYDVSRWGRFQDADESAYYEFSCREAGIAVHDCAEQFENEGSSSSDYHNVFEVGHSGGVQLRAFRQGVRWAMQADTIKLPDRAAQRATDEGVDWSMGTHPRRPGGLEGSRKRTD